MERGSAESADVHTTENAGMPLGGVSIDARGNSAMGETKIEWADFSFNPWLGCTKVSDACDNCYAESWAKRSGLVTWGAGQPRRRTSEANWRKPLAWDRKAAAAGKPRRVFTGSLCDWADNEVPAPWRDDLWRLIGRTPHLIWMPLTKRPKIAADLLATPDYLENLGLDYEAVMARVWIGMTAEHQSALEAGVGHLLRIPAAVRFLSCEPLLGPVDVTRYMGEAICGSTHVRKGESFERCDLTGNPCQGIHWIIAGGESGPKARPSHPDWFRSLRDQATAAGVPFFFKQWGEFGPSYDDPPPVTRVGDDEVVGLGRIGKARAGRLLDGREWNEVPG